jgi:hypothetical protein
MVVGLSDGEFNWIPSKTKGRSIHSYFRHILNAEIFWLLKMGYSNLDYFGHDIQLEKLFLGFEAMEDYLLGAIREASEEQMEITQHILENEETIQTGTLGWMIWRTSMHALHHFAQIAYIRHALENPPAEDDNYNWSKVMDSIVLLKLEIQ